MTLKELGFGLLLLVFVFISCYTEAAIYNLQVCGDTKATIVEREIDGRYVSLPLIYSSERQGHLTEWFKEGIEESIASNEVYVYEVGDCDG